MDFDFPLIPLLPLPITLVPAATFAALENSQNQIQQAYASSVSIGLSKNSTSHSNTSFSSSLGTTTPTGAAASSNANTALSDQVRLGAIVDALGQASAKAQELPTSITQTLRLAKNPTQRVYILRTGLDSGEDQWLDQLEIGSPLMIESLKKSLWDLNESSPSAIISAQEDASKRSSRSRSEEKGVYVAGMLKIGEKKLFIVDKTGVIHEQEACCVLDFYVDQSCQRRGFGKLLFDYMLKVEDIEPNQIAYDRPSPKLYGFLSKHFQLDRHLPQPNMFAIFEGYKLQDCGDPIQVDDDDSLTLGRNTSSMSSSPPKDNTSVTNPANVITKAPVVSRALQSSVVFSLGTPADHSVSGTQQPTNKHVSSAFSSSISLSGSTSVNNSNNMGPCIGRSRSPISISTTSSNASSSPLSPNTPQSHAGPARISRLLASSIVFADPTLSD